MKPEGSLPHSQVLANIPTSHFLKIHLNTVKPV